MGRRQVVRHRVLVPTFAGSNPAGPAKASVRAVIGTGFCFGSELEQVQELTC